MVKFTQAKSTDLLYLKNLKKKINKKKRNNKIKIHKPNCEDMNPYLEKKRYQRLMFCNCQNGLLFNMKTPLKTHSGYEKHKQSKCHKIYMENLHINSPNFVLGELIDLFRRVDDMPWV